MLKYMPSVRSGQFGLINFKQHLAKPRSNLEHITELPCQHLQHLHIPGGLQSNLGHALRLPFAKSLRWFDSLHQGVCQGCLGSHKPGKK